MAILLILGILCIIAAVVLIVLAFLPFGGGWKEGDAFLSGQKDIPSVQTDDPPPEPHSADAEEPSQDAPDAGSPDESE